MICRLLVVFFLLITSLSPVLSQKLKKADKIALRDSYDMLITIYESRKDKPKIDAWTDKYNNVDKVH